MKTNEILNLLLVMGGAIALAIVIIKMRCTPKFRIIETTISPRAILHTPQVKIKGVWYNIYKLNNKPYPCSFMSLDYLSPNDALRAIESFKSAGKFELDSNLALNDNQRSIIVE